MAKSNDKIYPHTFRKAKGVGVYMDYAASVAPNPSSIHTLGVGAKAKLENAHRVVADVLGARSEEIIFTSGGTESNNLAIQGMVFKFWEPSSQKGTKLPKLSHLITTNIEHPSVLETFKLLEKRKLAEISIVPVEANGIVDPKKIKKEIKDNTILVSVMYANNEIGTIQPIKEIAKEIRHYRKGKHGILETWERDGASTRNFSVEKYPCSKTPCLPVLHTDAVQASNYLDLNVEKLGVDMMTISGAKIEGAGRVGVLYKKKVVPLVSIFGGGDQEMGLRPGTENLPEILKFSTAFKFAQKNREKENKRIEKLRDYFITKLNKAVPLGIFGSRGSRFELKAPEEGRRDQKLQGAELIFNGDLKNRLPNNINVTFANIPSDLLVIELSAKGIMASSKSACKSSNKEGSYVIKAINPSIDSEIGGLRFSLGRSTTKKDIDYTIKILSAILTKLKKWYY